MVRTEDPFVVPKAWHDCVIVTVSDSASQGLRTDSGGALAQTLLEKSGFRVVGRVAVADEEAEIAKIIADWCDRGIVGVVVTTGGTGLGPRDVTPQATLRVCEYQVPGMAEAMRAASLSFTPFAMISRQVVAVRRRTLVINLPGSPKAVKQCLDTVAPVLAHAVDLLHGVTGHKEA